MQYKIWGVNLILVLASIFALSKGIAVWGGARDSANSSGSIPSETISVEDYAAMTPGNTIPKAYYNAIVDANLFSPQRSEYVPEKMKNEMEIEPELEDEALPVTRKNIGIILFGTILLDDYKAAIIGNPKDRNKQIVLHEREEVDGMVLYEVREDRILVASDGKLSEVLLFDSENPKRRISVARRTAPKVVSPPVADKTAAPPIAKEKPRIKPKTEDDEWEYVDTPFGRVRRKKK